MPPPFSPSHGSCSPPPPFSVQPVAYYSVGYPQHDDNFGQVPIS
jgi:hypothetical protein